MVSRAEEQEQQNVKVTAPLLCMGYPKITLTLLEQKEYVLNTPGNRGGPGGLERTLVVKTRKTAENQLL